MNMNLCPLVIMLENFNYYTKSYFPLQEQNIIPKLCSLIHLISFSLHHFQKLWKLHKHKKCFYGDSINLNCSVTVEIHLHDEGIELILCWILTYCSHDTEQLFG